MTEWKRETVKSKFRSAECIGETTEWKREMAKSEFHSTEWKRETVKSKFRSAEWIGETIESKFHSAEWGAKFAPQQPRKQATGNLRLILVKSDQQAGAAMTRTYHGIQFDSAKIADFCRRHGILKLSLFGSILRDDFRPDSDIDVLVEFGPEGSPSLLDLGGMLMELTEMLGRQVDLKTWGFISDRIRPNIEKE